MPKQKPNEQVQQIPLSEIRPFKNHPFKVTDDELMQQTIDSIMQVGVLNPAIIRPALEGGYEMVAGHRRLHAADLAGLKTIPAIVRNLDDDEAVILMVDSNLQRETISPMERAQAYKMKLEALKHQGKRVDLEGKSTSTQIAQKLSVEKVAAEAGTSRDQVRRYIRLTELLPEVQKRWTARRSRSAPPWSCRISPMTSRSSFWTQWTIPRTRPRFPRRSGSRSSAVREMHEGGHALHHVRGKEGGTGAYYAEQRYPPQIFPPKLHAPANAADHHQAAGAVAEKQQRRNER